MLAKAINRAEGGRQRPEGGSDHRLLAFAVRLQPSGVRLLASASRQIPPTREMMVDLPCLRFNSKSCGKAGPRSGYFKIFSYPSVKRTSVINREFARAGRKEWDLPACKTACQSTVFRESLESTWEKWDFDGNPLWTADERPSNARSRNAKHFSHVAPST